MDLMLCVYGVGIDVGPAGCWRGKRIKLFYFDLFLFHFSFTGSEVHGE